MALYPGALPVAGSASASDTLAAAGHTSLHNTDRDEIRAVATKIGTGSSTPASGTVLRATGAGTSAWGQVDLAADVTGTLPVARGGTGATTSTGSGSTVLSVAPTLTTPTIADLTNMNHTHASAAQGGLLDAAIAIIAGTVTPNALVSGTGSSWAWQSWTPTWTNLTVSSSTVTARFIQIGKIVVWRLAVVLGGGNAPSGAVRFTLPVTAATHAGTVGVVPFGEAALHDVGVVQHVGRVVYRSTTQAEIYVINTAGTYATDTALSATVPFGFGDTDEIIAAGFYEAA